MTTTSNVENNKLPVSEQPLIAELDKENELKMEMEIEMKSENELQLENKGEHKNENGSEYNNEQKPASEHENEHEPEQAAKQQEMQLQLVKSPSTAPASVPHLNFVLSQLMAPEIDQTNAESLNCQPLVLATTGSNCHHNMQSRLKAAKFVSLLLNKLWQNRRAEVLELQNQVRRLQKQAIKSQNYLFMHNQVICTEQRRSENLKLQLIDAVNRVEDSSHNVEQIELELRLLRQQDVLLREELQFKRNECETFAELLQETKVDFFRELNKFRLTTLELTATQRQIHHLQLTNAELEDKLLNIKDSFQTQNDQMAMTLTNNQESLQIAFESLRRFEQSLDELNQQHLDLLQNRDNAAELDREIDALRRELGLVRYLYSFYGPQRWRQLCVHCAERFYHCYGIPTRITNLIHPYVPEPRRNPLCLAAAVVCIVIAMRYL